VSTHDFPDWQGGVNARSPVLYNQAAVSLGTGSAVLLANTPTLHYGYLMLYGRVQGNNGQIDVFFTDVAGVQQHEDIRFLVAQNVFVYTVPVMLDQVQIQANRAAGAAATIDLYVCLTDVAYYKTQLALEQLMSATIGPLAQNATGEATFFPFAGNAQLEIESTQSGFNSRVKCYDLDGATVLGRTQFLTTTGSAIASPIWLPPTINAVSVTNNNASAATFTVYAFAEAAVPK
jgi:hypothetical protein